MVTFRLVEETDTLLTWWYFPKGKEEEGHGVIVIDKTVPSCDVKVLAPTDVISFHTAESQNKSRAAMNAMREDMGYPPLTEEEWPIATKDRYATEYADHAVEKIVNAFNAGNILRSGSAVWND